MRSVTSARTVCTQRSAYAFAEGLCGGIFTTAPQGLMNEGTGHGLIGMRERAAAAGGTLGAGLTAAGGYRVTATLPVLNAATAGPAESAAAMRDPQRSDKPVTS